MKNLLHKILIVFYLLTGIGVTLAIIYYGFSYYNTPLEERFFHELNEQFKPSGILGHGFGIIGTIMMLLGVSLYMIRKRFRTFSRLGLLKYWLEFHIYLCTLGPILILFHTAFKFGGIVAISFWSMTAVFLSGILGRFIYLQIPRSIEGNVLSLSDLQKENNSLSEQLINKYSIDESLQNKIEQLVDINTYRSIRIKNILIVMMKDFFSKRKLLRELKKELVRHGIDKHERKDILRLSSSKVLLARRIGLLSVMQKIFNYWHIVHLPFALIMIIFMVIHVAVTITFGYKWIF